MPRRNPFLQRGGSSPASPPSQGWDSWGASSTEQTGAVTEPEPQDAAAPHIMQIPSATWKKQKRPDRRARGKGRSILFLPKIKQRLDRQANRLGVPRYELTRYLLEFGLDAVSNGTLQFDYQLTQVGLTLYPDEKPRRRTHRAPKRVRVTERGIPDETWARVIALTDMVPIWQIVNRLLEYGLDEMDAGRLRLQVHRSGSYTLYG